MGVKSVLVLVVYLLGCLATLGVNLAMVVIGGQQDHTTREIDIIPVFLQVSGGIMIVFAVIHLLSVPICAKKDDYDDDDCCEAFCEIFLGCVG